MRHRKKTIKLGRTSSHRDALLSGMVCDLIAQKRITTTLPKAKAVRSLAEKMVTLGKRGTLAARRQAVSKLHQKDRVASLFDSIAPEFKERAGGYTRIVKLGRRSSDSSEMAILEWVGTPAPKAEKKKKAAKAEAKDADAKKADAAKPAPKKAAKKATTAAKDEAGEAKTKKPAAKKTTRKKKADSE